MKKKPSKYRVRNWREYNAGLEQRGSLTVWLDERAIKGWLNEAKTGKRGASNTYSDLAIETVVMMKNIYTLAGRQAVGLVKSVFKLLAVDLSVPTHSTLSRRLAGLEVSLPVLPKQAARHVVIDATGIKVYGEGEWKTRQHGTSKRRTWRKLHLAVDEQTGEIVAAEVSYNDKKDSQLLDALLEQIPDDLEQVSADGAYDSRDCYKAIAQRNAKAAIPPRQDAKIWQHGNCKRAPHPRDENLRLIRKHGRAKWKRLCNYHRRSLAETTMFRFKTIFGDKAAYRRFQHQVAELKLKAKALNVMSHLAMPDSYQLF